MTEFSGEIPGIRPSRSMSLLPPPNIDTKIIKQIGNYTLGAEIGSGAFGKVVLGKHIITGETVAIKILDKIILNQTPEDYELVKNEMSILKLVKHKYIIQLYEILQTPNHIFIVMEYCEGKDIMDYILSRNYLTESDSLKYFQQLINALFYLHSQNIAHRDIKIDNILLDRYKNLKLIDFGLSTKYLDDKLLDQPCGTIVYSAPEVLEGQPYHGMLADVWSSGIVLYGMLSGYLPFSDNDDNVNKKLIIEGKIEMPENFSPWVKDLLKHMLDVNPMTRYTLQDIKEHPWFNMNDFILIQGIIIGYHRIPVDETILDLCEFFNYNKNKVRNSIINNKFDSGSALYYLLVKQRSRKGITSVSDLFSEKFINFIYNDCNLIKNINKELENKKKDSIINEENNKIKKHESDLSAAPGLLNNIVITPKKNKQKNVIITDKNNEKKTNIKKNTSKSKNSSKNNIRKRNKKIKLFSSINKKSISKIQKTNNYISKFFEENRKTEENSYFYTYKVLQNKKSKNKISANVNTQINKSNKYLNSQIKDSQNNKIKNNKNDNSPYLKDKLIFNNKKRTPIKIKRKEKINIEGNSFLESTIQNNLNKELSLKEFLIKRNIEEEYSSTTYSNNAKRKINSKEKNNKSIQYSKNRTQQLPKSNKKMIKNNEILQKNKKSENTSLIQCNKSNNKIIYHRNNNSSFMNKFKMSKSIESTDTKIDFVSYNKIIIKKNNINNISKDKSLNKIKNEKEKIILNKSKINSTLKKRKNSKNSTPINKILRNTINYLSNNVSTTNSQDKKKFKTNIKLQNRNNKNNLAFSNYTCSRSTNNINSNTRNNTTNNISSNKKSFINNFDININHNKIINLKQKFTKDQYDISYNLINENDLKNKSPLINYFKEGKNNKAYKTFYNNNIKLVKINKIENLKKNNNCYAINNNILNEIKNKLHQSIKQPQILLEPKNNSNFNSVISVTKHKNKINLNNQNINQKTENISMNLVNSRSRIQTEYLTSPNQSKIKPKIKHNNKDSFIEEKNKKNQSKKRHFESSVITYRYKSPIATRGISESPKQKYLNEKTRCSQLPWKIKKKGIDEKLSEEIVYKKYIHKIKKNPFIINNNKINKNIKNKNISNNNKQKSSSLNKNKSKNKINSLNKINVCYSKDNLYSNVPNLNYRVNSPNNQNMKNKLRDSNNHSLNFLDIKTFPLLKAINKKYFYNSNKRIYHRNINQFNTSNTNVTNNTNMTNTNNNYFYNFAISTSMSMNSIGLMKEKQKVNKFNIFDLSCIIVGKKNLNECCVDLVNKFKKHAIYFTQKKNNIFSFRKNGEYCEIEIVQLNVDTGEILKDNQKICNNEGKRFPLFYYKINKKKGLSKNKFVYNVIFST